MVLNTVMPVAGAYGYHSSEALLRERAVQALYASARGRGRRIKFWSMLVGRPCCLLDLASIEARCDVTACYEAGVRTVSIERICGSEGRACDFDRDFHPLQDHTRERWLGIATARKQGKPLPPVSLVQVGDFYFVRDGHHRISVARALGQQDIEARVTVWQLSGPLSPETPVVSPGSGSKDRLPSFAAALGWLGGVL